MNEVRFTLEKGKCWEGVVHQVDDPICPPGSGHITLFADRPDFVVYPEAREFADLAGRRGNIIHEKCRMIRCPICKTDGNRTAWTTEHGFEVVMCQGCKQYIWLRRFEEEEK